MAVVTITRKWNFGNNDLGDYLECDNCKHKIAAKDVIFGTYDLNTCPYCKSNMEVDEEDIEHCKEGYSVCQTIAY